MNTKEQLEQAAAERKDSIENGWRTLLDDHCWLLATFDYNVDAINEQDDANESRFKYIEDDVVRLKHNSLGNDLEQTRDLLALGDRVDTLERKINPEWLKYIWALWVAFASWTVLAHYHVL